MELYFSIFKVEVLHLLNACTYNLNYLNVEVLDVYLPILLILKCQVLCTEKV